MALLDGKQLRNDSTELGKLSGSGIVSFTAATMSFTSGSVLTTATANIVNPTDVVNKEYVDSVAAGLDPKQSVAYTTTGNISLGYLTTQTNGDWSGTLTDGDRILVKNQTDKTENGIWVAADGDWNRAEDHDGTPANEVTLGNFTFVEYGTLAGSGYVLHSTDSTNTPIITPGSDEQEWTLYSQAGAYTAGTGLNLTDGEFEIDATGVAAGSYGSADSTTTFTVNDEGQLTAAADTQISIVAEQVTDFDLAAETAIFEDPNFVDGTTIDFTVTAGDSVTAEVIDSSLTSDKLDTGTNGGATAGYVLSVDGSGDFKWILDEGDISSVEAGNGLIGGGAEGDVTLNLGGVALDDITFDFGMSASINFGSQGANQQVQNFNVGARNVFFMGYKQTGIPSGSFSINDTYTTLTSDVVSGNTLVMGNTVSLTGSTDINIVAATGKLDMSSPEVNVGSSSTNDLKLNGEFILASASNLQLNAGDLNGPSYSTVQLYNDSIGIHASGFTDFTSQGGLNISTSGTANINGNTFSVGAQNFDFQGSHFQQSVNDSYTASIGGSYSVDAGNVTLKSYGDFKLNGDYISASGSAFDVTTDLVSIDSGTGPSQFLSGTDTTISASASLNLTADEGNISIGDGKGLQYVSDYSSTFVDNSLVTKKYVDSLDAAQITGVSAGNGLFGGGTAGDVTLTLGGTVSEDIDFNFGGSASLYLGSQGPNKQMVHFNAQTENLFLYTVDNNFMGSNMSGPPMGSLRMAKDAGIHTTYLTNSPVDGKVSVFAYTASLSGTDVDVLAVGPQANLKLSSSNELEIEGLSMSIESASMSITSDAYTLGQTGASFSYDFVRSGVNYNNYDAKTEFIIGSASSKLTSSVYSTGNGHPNGMGIVDYGLEIGTSSSKLSFIPENYDDRSELTLGVSGSSFVSASMSIVSASMSIQSEAYTLGQTGASFSYETNISSDMGLYPGKNEFEIGLTSSKLTNSVYDQRISDVVDAGLVIGSSSTLLSHARTSLELGTASTILSRNDYDNSTGNFEEVGSLSISATGSSFVAGSMSITSDAYTLGQTGASFSFNTNSSGDSNDFTINASQSSLSYSSYDTNINSSRTAGLTISATGSYLYGGTNEEFGSLTLGGSGSSFVAGSMSIQSDNFNITGTGASFSFGNLNNGGNNVEFSIGTQSGINYYQHGQQPGSGSSTGFSKFSVGTQSGINLTTSGVYDSGPIAYYPNGLVVGSQSANLTISTGYNYNTNDWDVSGLQVGTVSTLSGGTASIVLGGTGASGPISITGLASYTEDYSAQFGTHSLVTKAYVDSLDAAQITGVSAGNGLIGGGTAGTVELNLGGTVSTDIDFDFGGSNGISFGANGPQKLASNFSVGAGTFSVFSFGDSENPGPPTANITAGSFGFIAVGANGNVFDLGTQSSKFSDYNQQKGIEYGADYSANFTDRSLVDKAYADTKVSGVTAGAGLSGGGVDGDITLNADITIDGGLTFSSTGDAGTIEVVVDNSTIQVVNGALAVVAGTSQPVYQSATCSVANGDTGIALTSTPNDYSRIEVYVNGQLQNLTENTTGDCYFGAAGTVLTSLTSGDSLHWNSANAGFELSATDVIKVHYQA